MSDAEANERRRGAAAGAESAARSERSRAVSDAEANERRRGAAAGAEVVTAEASLARSSRQSDIEALVASKGGDWDALLDDIEYADSEQIILNMGPQHPSTHGVLRLILDIDGETVTKARAVIGYLHTGIEKSTEYRTFTQAVQFLTRADYLSPTFNETCYCLAVEKLLGIEVPRRATIMRVLLMEITRISSHLVAIATGGMETGALTGMTMGFREREEALHVMELITGLRMNQGFVRPGGVAQDMPDGWQDRLDYFITVMNKRLPEYDELLTGQPIWKARLQGIGYLPVQGCLQLGVTGPPLRSSGLAWDLRKTMPYCGYEEYDFDVPTTTNADSYDRYLLRVAEMHESLKIIKQCRERLREPGPVMVEDKKIGWPARLSVGADGTGNSLEHIRHIMGESMEALIHHFKLVTEGFTVPVGQAYAAVEGPRGELAAHVVSNGGTKPWRVHLRDPGFVNLQAVSALCEGGMVSDVVVAIASLDPVLGGVDR